MLYSKDTLNDLYAQYQNCKDGERKRDIMNEICIHVEPFINHLAIKYGAKWRVIEELEEYAYDGVLLAFRDFDANHKSGTTFSTYIINHIKFAIMRFLAKRPDLDPYELRILRYELEKTGRKILHLQHNKMPKYELSTQQTEPIIRLSVLDEKTRETTKRSFVIKDKSKSHEKPFDDLDLVKYCLSQVDLTERERYIIDHRFFKDEKMREIAKQIGITKQRVEQLLNKALEKIRERVNINNGAETLTL